jgi:glutathione S-transferase
MSQRLVEMWTELLAEHGGPMLFGHFTIADAYFAPVCMRLKTYALPVPSAIGDYVEAGARPAWRAGLDR